MLESTSCCGLDIFDGLSNPLQVLNKICRERYSDGGTQAFVCFTDTVSNGNGKNLCDYINKNKLGVVISTRQKKNPNSGNVIKVWIWSPNERNLKAWAKINCPDYYFDNDTDWADAY